MFALQNKRLHAAEKAKEDLEQKHAEDIAALEAKHADSTTQLAYDAATIRTLREERDQITLEYNDLLLLKDRLSAELLDLRQGGTGTLTDADLANDPHKQAKETNLGKLVGPNPTLHTLKTAPKSRIQRAVRGQAVVILVRLEAE